MWGKSVQKGTQSIWLLYMPSVVLNHNEVKNYDLEHIMLSNGSKVKKPAELLLNTKGVYNDSSDEEQNFN